MTSARTPSPAASGSGFRYRADDAELKQHARALPVLSSDARFAVHAVGGSSPAAVLGRTVEAQVFDEFFGNDTELMQGEYGPYEESSAFLLAIDLRDQVCAGVVRLILPSSAGLKSLNDIRNPAGPWGAAVAPDGNGSINGVELPHEATIDVATLAVAPAYRSRTSAAGVSVALLSSCIGFSDAHSYSHWVAILDMVPFSLIQAFGEPFLRFPGLDPAPYLDSGQSLPVHLELSSAHERVRHNNRDAYRLLVEREGLRDKYVFADHLPDPAAP